MRRHTKPAHMTTQVIGESLYGGLTMMSGLQANTSASHSMTDVPLVPNHLLSLAIQG